MSLVGDGLKEKLMRTCSAQEVSTVLNVPPEPRWVTWAETIQQHLKRDAKAVRGTGPQGALSS